VDSDKAEEAREELAKIQDWLRDFESRMQQSAGLRERAAFLTGVIAALEQASTDKAKKT
jgi:nitrate reductase assembly molybdenum cofactor insertion protein NarJ